MHLTPYLAMVIAGNVVFIVVLGTVWLQGMLADARQARPAADRQDATAELPRARAA
jgi:hypothetical protein